MRQQINYEDETTDERDQAANDRGNLRLRSEAIVDHINHGHHHLNQIGSPYQRCKLANFTKR